MPYLVQQNRRVGGEDIDSVGWPPIRSSPAASMSSSSAAATRRRTASAPRSARAPSVTQLDIRPQPPEKERQARRLALLGDQDAHLVLAGRRRGARVPGRHARVRRRGRWRQVTGVKCCQVDDRASRSRARSSSSRPISPSSPSASPAAARQRAEGSSATSSRSTPTRGSTNVIANERDYKTSVDKLWPPATCAAASRWWSGRSAKAARRRAPFDRCRPDGGERRCRVKLYKEARRFSGVPVAYRVLIPLFRHGRARNQANIQGAARRLWILGSSPRIDQGEGGGPGPDAWRSSVRLPLRCGVSGSWPGQEKSSTRPSRRMRGRSRPCSASFSPGERGSCRGSFVVAPPSRAVPPSSAGSAER
jgi:hypothetical protein